MTYASPALTTDASSGALLQTLAIASLILTGGIFGFFYAWICSTMWGLDATDPRVAIEAMNAMNVSVRNAVFMPAFFGTPVALVVTSLVAFMAARQDVALLFGAAGVIYLIGGIVLTANFNVPMNEELKLVVIPENVAEAQAIWDAYSPRWQMFNIIRTCVAAVSLTLVGIGLIRL